MAAQNPIPTPLPADLPENWSIGQTVSPAGTDVGLTQQHGYNYLMEQVNAAQEAANTIGEAFTGLASVEDLESTETDLSALQSSVQALQSTTQEIQGDITNLEGEVTTLQSSKASTFTLSATLTAAGWTGDAAPYTQTVTVTGITAAMNPLVDVVLSDDTETALAQLEGWGYVSSIVTGAGNITARCLEDKPTVDIEIQLKVVQ